MPGSQPPLLAFVRDLKAGGEWESVLAQRERKASGVLRLEVVGTGTLEAGHLM